MSTKNGAKIAKEKAVVVCPGRGSYTKDTLNYFQQFTSSPHSLFLQKFLGNIDSWRKEAGYLGVTELDREKNFSVPLHTPGENASALIYACALADFHSIDRDRYEIVAVTGNSMGWYLALACAQVLDEAASYHIVQTMGQMMKEKIIGGQIIYPIIGPDWTIDSKKEEMVYACMDKVNQLPDHQCYLSIYLGGYLVLAGNNLGINRLLKELPSIEHYPFKLVNHAAFHTPLLQKISELAFQQLGEDLFHSPQIPLIDGRGKIWMPYQTSINEIYDYTFGHQVVAPYDFTTGLSVAIKEFAPSKIILLGPGNSLGGAIGQILIHNQWQRLRNKEDFQQRQKSDHPLLLSMGLADQRREVLAKV